VRKRRPPRSRPPLRTRRPPTRVAPHAVSSVSRSRDRTRSRSSSSTSERATSSSNTSSTRAASGTHPMMTYRPPWGRRPVRPRRRALFVSDRLSPCWHRPESDQAR
jgi:hypothetical protein